MFFSDIQDGGLWPNLDRAHAPFAGLAIAQHALELTYDHQSMIIVQQAFGPRCMITLPELAAEALGSFLASDIKDRFGASHARLAELIPFAARLTLECIGNSDALYHNVEHTMLVTLAGHDIFKGSALLKP